LTGIDDGEVEHTDVEGEIVEREDWSHRGDTWWQRQREGRK